MGIGEATRNAVTSAINVLGSTVTLTPYTQAASDGGYSGEAETDSTSVSETAIPFEEFKEMLKRSFGNLEIGGLQVALKYSATVDISGATKYKAVWQDDTYDVTKIQKYTIGEVLVAYIITLTKRID